MLVLPPQQSILENSCVILISLIYHTPIVIRGQHVDRHHHHVPGALLVQFLLSRPHVEMISQLLEEFDFCTHPYSNASVDQAGTLNPSSK